MRTVASLKICTLMCYFCRTYIMFQPKSTEELCIITLKNDAKFEEELTCALKNDMKYVLLELQYFKGVIYHGNDR